VRVERAIAPVTVVIDHGQLAEILVNLVANAYEAMPDGGVVTISARDGNPATIAVEDTGAGFDRTVAERLFEPFYTTKPSGTGLGLAIVRRLAENNGGEIAVDSHPGRGTRFTLALRGRPRSLKRGQLGRPPATKDAVEKGSAGNGTSAVGRSPAQPTR
jgi:signal transduction histidine kinase